MLCQEIYIAAGYANFSLGRRKGYVVSWRDLWNLKFRVEPDNILDK